MTYLRSISRFVVVFMALAGITAAAVPEGWIALRYEAPGAEDQKGHWIIVKAPEDGLAAWWSDAELAKIAANDPDYVTRLETDWTPTNHPVAEEDEAERLAVELARYWSGDLPQANFWAHGALTRRGDTLSAFRWEQDGLTQRTDLEDAGDRPKTAAAPIDPDPVDQRYDNDTDLVSYGDRWGSHLTGDTLDHVYTAERNKAQRRHHPNSPPADEVEEKTRETVEACREASLTAELGVFENYVRGWGGLRAKNVDFGLPANCVSDPGPLALAPPPPSPPPGLLRRPLRSHRHHLRLRRRHRRHLHRRLPNHPNRQGLLATRLRRQQARRRRMRPTPSNARRNPNATTCPNHPNRQSRISTPPATAASTPRRPRLTP